jgi:DNA adenine methylase
MTLIAPFTPAQARPFLKWVGGKQQLLAQFEALLPADFERYFEPFVGGGAVFFHLWRTAKLPKQAFLFDHNPEIINTYQIVRDHLDDLLNLLAEHQRNHCPAYFYQVRALDRTTHPLTAVQQAARTLYLNKTCYNGLYRVNRKGQFNAPLGRYTNPNILNEDVLRAASLALQNVAIEQVDFRQMPVFAQPGDFFYFDPPYHPVSQTANFTGYTTGNFSEQDQSDLATVFDQLTAKGCRCMLSNSHTPFIVDLYRQHTIALVSARRQVNSKANGRGGVNEVVIRNYTS